MEITSAFQNASITDDGRGSVIIRFPNCQLTVEGLELVKSAIRGIHNLKNPHFISTRNDGDTVRMSTTGTRTEVQAASDLLVKELDRLLLATVEKLPGRACMWFQQTARTPYSELIGQSAGPSDMFSGGA